MNLGLFFAILLVAECLVLFQAICSVVDGFFNQKQMLDEGYTGWAFIEHGGMWGDFYIISPLLAYLMSSYHFAYFSKGGLIILGVSLVYSVYAKWMFAKRSSKEPEAHAHNGRTTMAGWTHGVYEVWGFWIILMYFLTPTVPAVPIWELCLVAALMTNHFVLGVMKFNPRWMWSKSVVWQTVGMTCFVWGIVWVRL